jgi:hypothetical protein
MRNARSVAGVEGGPLAGPGFEAPPAPGFSRYARPEVSGVVSVRLTSVYAAADSSTRSRVRVGSTLTPGPIVVVNVTVRI